MFLWKLNDIYDYGYHLENQAGNSVDKNSGSNFHEWPLNNTDENFI